MEVMFTYLNGIIQLLKTPMQVYEYSFSFWDIALFSALGVILAGFIGRILDL